MRKAGGRAGVRTENTFGLGGLFIFPSCTTPCQDAGRLVCWLAGGRHRHHLLNILLLRLLLLWFSQQSTEQEGFFLLRRPLEQEELCLKRGMMTPRLARSRPAGQRAGRFGALATTVGG